ncbi:hypothetical protein PENTCL1PPCAC_14331, partial [Pristionchus entomophagus]
LCTCSASYTGVKCTILIAYTETIDTWLGPADTAKLQDIVNLAQQSPATLVDILPSLFASFTPEQQQAMSWTVEDLIDSLDYEMHSVDFVAAFTPVFDDQLGNCFTFNYANKTNSHQGLFMTRVAGQNRDFSVKLKLYPSEQVAWIDCAAISAYIHAPGTPPNQGTMYSLRGGASDLIGLRKTITKLHGSCIVSRAQLKKQKYYEDGDYTRDVSCIRNILENISQGCFSACYQDKVLQKCGCMDARLKKADSASKCLFKDKSCVDAVAAEFGPASSWSSCHCPPECYQEVYAISATQADLPYKIPTCNLTEGCSDLSQARARLTIYMETLESETFVEMEKMSFLTLLSQIGGQLGVLLGMSVVGILEILILCGQLGKDQCA